MTRGPRYAPAAERSLDAIADWTFDRFGPRQARRYVAAIRATCDRVARGDMPSRSVREAFAPEAPEDLRFVREGAHLILFREREGEVEITDVLHGAMDLPGRVRG